MKNQLRWFNIYLALLLILGAACQTTRKKELTKLGLFLEVTPDATGRNSPVTIGRQERFVINAEKQPFLDERSVKEASLVDAVGGFQIMLQFDRRGTWLLEQYSVANRGRRVAIMATFGEVRWLGAPVMGNRIPDGLLVFTPDASRDEAERIVRGLKNVAKQTQKHNP